MVSFAVKDEFAELQEFTSSLPERFDRIGEIIQDNRNVIKKVTTNHGIYVVKNFKGMYFLNRLVYSLFRKSKAERSFIYSSILNDKGIETPPPVSWLNCYKWGLLTESYFVSVYHPYQTLQQVLRSNSKINDLTYRTSLYRDLAAFTLKLHKTNIYHRDYSVGNIMIIPDGDHFQFALVDLNRIKFPKRISFQKALRNFTTLGIPTDDMNRLVHEYATLSNQSPEAALEIFWRGKRRTSTLRKLRKDLRRYTLTPLEKLSATITSDLRAIFGGHKNAHEIDSHKKQS